MDLEVTVSQFVTAIRNKQMVILRFYSKEDGRVIERRCAPMDYGPSRRAHIKIDKFHLWDYESDTKNHTLSIDPNQLVELIVLDEDFDPSSFITWDTQNSPWFIERDWGTFS